MKLPYGISDIATITKENYDIVDKTNYIRTLENLDQRYLFLLRPRRFGKSLFISIMHHYYATEYKDDFNTIFGKYDIGKNPTKLANTYRVLRFNFSGVDTKTPESTFAGFLGKVSDGIKSFINTYNEINEEKTEILSKPAPNLMMTSFFGAYKKANIYLLIDEYDHFANELLAFDFKSFMNFVTENGFVRKFYEVIKEATEMGTVNRIFVTGVTPITLDSMTSGFNIATDLSKDFRFNEMFGFTQDEVSTLTRKSLGVSNLDFDSVMSQMKKNYDGYLFSIHSSTRIYNPDMVLYFLEAFQARNAFPELLIDSNIASDYGKIRNLFNLNEPFNNMKKLDELIETGETKAMLTNKFSFERGFTSDDFVSLMYYVGLVAIRGIELARLIFSFPNYVIEELYREFFINHVRENSKLDIESESVDNAMVKLAMQNQITPFVELIEHALQTLSNQDFKRFDEKYIKALLVGFASLTKVYFIKSEYEFDKHYPYIMFLHRPPIDAKYQFIFELKYLAKSNASKLKEKADETEQQLKGYLQKDEIKTLKNLKAYMLIFVGDKAEVIKELNLNNI